MAQTSPTTFNLEKIKYKIENGDIKIPQFQRDFVWSMEASAKLMDSIIKGYPVGVFTFWKTKERLRSVKSIGSMDLPDVPYSDYVNYVLDGQQRITSIYASITGAKVGVYDYSQIFVDLTAAEDEPIVIINTGELENDKYISLKEVYRPDLTIVMTKYLAVHKKIQEYNRRLTTYSFSGIEIEDSSLDVATEIFTRINTTGKSLSVFEIMCAKTYDEEEKFDLYERRQFQIEKWENVNYETIPHQTVLQAVAVCILKSCKRKEILGLDKKQFIKVWNRVDVAFDSTIDFLKSSYGIPVSRMLPYDAVMVPFVYYFFKKKKKPEGKSADYLRDYFWRVVLTKRFTEGVESKIAMDCSYVIDPVINGKKPESRHLPAVDISFESIKQNGEFSLGSAYIKGLICILASQHPQSFLDGSEVTIDNAWLSQSNSKNYHHFFPKAYMKKNQSYVEESLVNHIANITIVDGYLNKGRIKDKAPSVYMTEFKSKNRKLKKTMETHLINNLESFGIWDNDYSTFFTSRISSIQSELKNRLIEKADDRGFADDISDSSDNAEGTEVAETPFDISDESEYHKHKVGLLARQMITYLLMNGLITEDEQEKLKGKEYSRSTFRKNVYPVLADSKFDNMGNSKKPRYYATPVVIKKKPVYISSQWYEDSREDLIKWFKKHL